jgi:two-component system, LytTR family, response regulator
VNILIVEDEAPSARRLERILSEHLGARLTRTVSAPTLNEARTALKARNFDLILLDLDLAGADGFALLREGGALPRVIVVSGRSDRAIDAFDHAVVDFVTKPVSAERLARALDRAAKASPSASMSLAVRSAGRIDLAAFTDIVLLSGADDYVEVVLADGRRFLHDTRLQDLEKRLPPGFVRVHRSHIANAAHVRSIRTLPGRRRELTLTGGAGAPVSRGRLSTVEAVLRSCGS